MRELWRRWGGTAATFRWGCEAELDDTAVVADAALMYGWRVDKWVGASRHHVTMS